VLSGVASKSLLKVRLRCKPGHALPCEDRQPPQNQLQLANASQKKLRGGLRCAKRAWHLKPKPHHLLRIRSSAKSIAFAECTCRKRCMWAAMWPLLKVRAQVQSQPRRITCGIPPPFAPLRYATPLRTPHPQHRKINCTLQNAPAQKFACYIAA